MSVVVPRRAINVVAAAANPKQAIIESVGDLKKVHICADMVLIGIYFRPEKTAGGIYRPDANVEEDMWQGKVGLLLASGPDAFKDTHDYTFSEPIPKVGDWVVYKVGDAWSLNINKYPCRLVRDVNIRITLDDPEIVF